MSLLFARPDRARSLRRARRFAAIVTAFAVGATAVFAPVVAAQPPSLRGAAATGASVQHAPPTTENDVAAITQILRDQYDALIAMDAARYASHLAPDAVWENALGDRYIGRDSIEAFNQRVAATMRGARYDDWQVTITVISPRVALADVTTVLRGQNIGGRRLVDRPMLNVYVLRRDDARWRVAHTRIRDQWVLRYAEGG